MRLFLRSSRNATFRRLLSFLADASVPLLTPSPGLRPLLLAHSHALPYCMLQMDCFHLPLHYYKSHVLPAPESVQTPAPNGCSHPLSPFFYRRQTPSETALFRTAKKQPVGRPILKPHPQISYHLPPPDW